MQTGEAPPSFRLEVNDRSLMTRDYGFWLENRLRQRFDLDGVPLVIEVRTQKLSRGAHAGAGSGRGMKTAPSPPEPSLYGRAGGMPEGRCYCR